MPGLAGGIASKEHGQFPHILLSFAHAPRHSLLPTSPDCWDDRWDHAYLPGVPLPFMASELVRPPGLEPRNLRIKNPLLYR